LVGSPKGEFLVRTTPGMTNMIDGTYGFGRVSKTDDAPRNLETQLHFMQE
jgi:hypothetical protein